VAKKGPLPVRIEVEGFRETLKALNKVDAEGKKQAKAKGQEIANKVAGFIRAAAPADRRYQNLAATVRSGKDRVPVVRIGGRQTPRASGGATPSDLIYGMEFGASSPRNAWRFPPRTPKLGRGNAGYWIYPTARARQVEIRALWLDGMNDIIRRWSK
jgi:hypothetical protein